MLLFDKINKFFSNYGSKLVLTTALVGGGLLCTEQDKIEAQGKTRDVPIYLENIVKPDNDVDRFFEVYKILTTYGSIPSDSIFVNNNIIIKENICDKEVLFVFHNYVDKGEYVAYYDTNGIHKLTREDFALVKEDIISLLKDSVGYVYSVNSEINKKRLEAQEKFLKEKNLLTKEEKLEEYINRKIEGYEDLTWGDLLNTPIVEKKSLVPNEFHLVHLGSRFLGLCYPEFGVLAYSPLARQIDFLGERTGILDHEVQHCQHKLIGSKGYDIEQHADMVGKVSPLDLLLHPYFKDSRDIAKVLFSFNSERVKEDLFDYSLFFRKLNRKEVERAIEETKKIMGVMQEKYLEEYIPELMSHYDFWSAVNEDLNDKNAFFKMLMYRDFEPTLLSGALNTHKFLKSNEEVIDEILKDSLRELKQVRNNPNDDFYLPKGDVLAHLFSKVKSFFNSKDNFNLVNFLDRYGFKDRDQFNEFLNYVEEMQKKGVIGEPYILKLER